MWLIHLWTGLSPWTRYGLGLLFIAISTGLWFGGWFWPYGWAVGVLMIIFGGPTSSEKKGYRF